MDDEFGYDWAEVEAIAETDKALLVKDESGEEHWIPKSQIHDDSEVFEKGQFGILIVTRWFAKKKKWLDE